MLDLGHHRTIALPLVAESDPNVTAPAVADIFVMRDSVPANPDQVTKRHVLVFDFSANEVASANFTTWVRDASSGRWFSIASEVSAPSRAIYVSPHVMSGDLFVQVTAIGGAATSTSVVVRAGESG